MKKEGIQTRNRKISNKLKKTSVCRDPRFDAANFKLFDSTGSFGAAAAAAAAYSGPFGQMHTFSSVHPHHHPHHPHMHPHLAASASFGSTHHPMLSGPHPHSMHPTYPAAAAAAAATGSGSLTLGLNHPNMVHAMGWKVNSGTIDTRRLVRKRTNARVVRSEWCVDYCLKRLRFLASSKLFENRDCQLHHTEISLKVGGRLQCALLSSCCFDFRNLWVYQKRDIFRSESSGWSDNNNQSCLQQIKDYLSRLCSSRWWAGPLLEKRNWC